MSNFRIFIFFLIFAPVLLQGQKLVVSGKVLDAESEQPLSGANILETTTKRNLVSDKNGNFVFSFSGNLKESELNFSFSYTGYQKAWIKIKPLKDSIYLLVKLKRKTEEFDPVTISPKPDTIVGNRNFFVQDFEFHEDRIVLLTFEKNTKKCKVMLSTEAGKILSTFPIPVQSEELFKDFLGYINVIGKDSVYRVLVEGDNIRLGSLNADDFNNLIRPCIDTLNGKIVFTDYRDDYPEFNYFMYERKDSTWEGFAHIVDPFLADLYAFEYDFLNNKQKAYALNLSLQTGIDKRIIAAHMTQFPKSRYFTPLYAPLFIVRDTICVFDHYKNKLFRFNLEGAPIDSSGISYHKPEKWREWRRKILKDEGRGGELYALFQKNGYYVLKGINPADGNVCSQTTLYFPYVNKIKVKDGYAWFIYRPFESLQPKFLYREKLQPCN